ncbi:MAG: D-alanyl-D-alanine carboxypeptidase, partial [Polyangiaceae bacterium]|nr:D-alanyl-D-alanine carboxypeptidase [Polyangiaceae bacterium]
MLDTMDVSGRRFRFSDTLRGGIPFWTMTLGCVSLTCCLILGCRPQDCSPTEINPTPSIERKKSVLPPEGREADEFAASELSAGDDELAQAGAPWHAESPALTSLRGRLDSVTPGTPGLARLERQVADFADWTQGEGGQLHARAIDTASGEVLFDRMGKKAANPASNMKLLTAAGALELLGPAYRFRTTLFGKITTEGLVPRLVLKGGGAPDLRTSDLARLARALLERGVQRVGDIIVDQARFSAQYIPPAYDEQPDEWAAFRAPI